MQAVVLAGGLSRRLGGTPKAGLILHGQTLLARTVDAAAQLLEVHEALAATAGVPQDTGPRIAVVGPAAQLGLWLGEAHSRPQLTVVQEDPPHSGPAAGIAAGLSVLPDRRGRVLVLACDMPRAAELLTVLFGALEGLAGDAGVIAVDAGRAQPLAAIYPEGALRSAVAKAREAHRLQNASVFSLLANVLLKDCPVPEGLAADIDTWDDARAQGLAPGPATAEG